MGVHMPNGLEITKAAIEVFTEIQDYMILVKKENATETYTKLKKKYLFGSHSECSMR